MAVFKNRGTWRAEVYIKGRRVASQSGFKKERDAKAWHDEQAVFWRKNPQDSKVHTMEELLKHFRTWHLPGVRPRTREIYEVDIRLRIEPFFRYLKLEAIDEPLLEQFKLEVSGKVGPKTANNCLDLLRFMLTKAVKWKMLRENPYSLDPVPEAKVACKWWSERGDIEKFLAAAKSSHYYGFYLAALETGMRLSELIGLSKSDIDFERGTIHVHRQWDEIRADYAPTKQNQERWIDFDPGSALGQELAKCCSRSKHPEAVFATKVGTRPLRSKVGGKHFAGVIKKAGVPKIRFHDTRHSFASWYMREVGDIWALKEILGHSDITTTQRYAHHAKKQRRQSLGLSERITHNSLTSEAEEIGREQDQREKPWWGCTESKRVAPLHAS